MNKDKIRFGIIGCSRIAKKAVLPAMMESQFAEIGIIGNWDKEKAVAIEYAGLFNCPKYGDYQDVINDDTIDAVYISLPNSMHEEWTIKAALNGKHVWCEKPSTTSYESAKKMVKACKDNHVRLFEGFMFRCHPQHKMVKELIDNNTLGDLLKFHGTFSFPMPGANSNLLKKELGGGSLNDSTSYPIYASRMIFGEEPVSVFSCFNIDAGSGVESSVDLLLKFPNGKTAYLSSAFGSYYQCSYSVLGSNARVILNRAYVVPPATKTKILLDINDEIQETEVQAIDQFRLFADDFCQEILGKTSQKDTEKDLINQAKVLEAARISFKENRQVLLSELK